MTALVLFAITSIVYLATAGYDDGSGDVTSANVGAWRIASTGQPWLEDLDLDEVSETWAPRWVTTSGEHTVISRTPGAIASAIPAYYVRQVFTGAGTAEPDFSFVPAAVAAALITATTVLLMWGALLRLVSRRWATLGALVFAFGTPVWSVAADGTWTHTVTLLGIAGMAWAGAHDRWLLVGIFGGVAAWGRLHTVLIAAGLGIVCAIVRRRPRIVLEVGAMGAVLVAGASLWSHWLYGSWMPSGGYSIPGYVNRESGALGTGKSVWDLLQNELALWISLDRGLLVWTPVVLLLIPALIKNRRDVPDWAWALLGSGLIYTILQGWLNEAHGGSVYGYRHSLELLACATPAMTIAATRTGPIMRNVLTVVVVIQFAAFAVGGALNRPLQGVDDLWRTNAFALALWQAPALVVVLLVLIGGAFWLRAKLSVGQRSVES